MFSGKLYLSISLSIESLSAIQPQQEEETECTEKKERSIYSQATGKMEQINSMKTETHVMQCLPSAQSKY